MMSAKDFFSQESVAKVIYAYIAAQIGLSAIPSDVDVKTALVRVEERIIAIDSRLQRIENQNDK